MNDQPSPHAALGTEPVRTIGREELKAKLDRGDPFKLIMALNRWAYDSKHIPGSLHFDTPAELYAAVQPDDEVVVYCSNVDCLSSVALYRDRALAVKPDFAAHLKICDVIKVRKEVAA